MRFLKRMLPAAGILALAGQLLAGGFYLQLGNPEANPEARKANAVLVVKATGCHDAAAAELTAKAIGIVDGKRKAIPLTVTKLSEPGTFAFKQQWPKEGKWVIHLEARESGRLTYALVPAGAGGLDRLHARFEMNSLPAGAVEAMLD